MPFILVIAAFGYFVFWGASYWQMDGSARIILFILLPATAVLLIFLGAIFKWKLIGPLIGSGLYLLFVYVLVCGFILTNMQQFLLCDYQYDHIYWSLEEILAWPYMLARGEKLPDEPCYWG
jgi:hypothetical protein